MGKKLLELYLHFINPLKPKIDKQQFKPNNIKSKTRGKVIRINILITQVKMLWSFISLRASSAFGRYREK